MNNDFCVTRYDVVFRGKKVLVYYAAHFRGKKPTCRSIKYKLVDERGYSDNIKVTEYKG